MAGDTSLPSEAGGRRIARVFSTLVSQIQDQATAVNHAAAIDVELNFKSANMTEKGWIIFGKDSQQTGLEIRLATQILPRAPGEAPPTDV